MTRQSSAQPKKRAAAGTRPPIPLAKLRARLAEPNRPDHFQCLRMMGARYWPEARQDLVDAMRDYPSMYMRGRVAELLGNRKDPMAVQDIVEGIAHQISQGYPAHRYDYLETMVCALSRSGPFHVYLPALFTVVGYQESVTSSAAANIFMLRLNQKNVTKGYKETLAEDLANRPDGPTGETVLLMKAALADNERAHQIATGRNDWEDATSKATDFLEKVLAHRTAARTADLRPAAPPQPQPHRPRRRFSPV